MRLHQLHRVVLPAFGLLSWACATDKPPWEDASRGQDSTGIPAHIPVLPPAPFITVGTGPDDVLFGVRAAVLVADRLVVASQGNHEVLFYDLEGIRRATVGREGSGPREFRAPWDMWRYRGDSLLVWDAQLRRASILTSSGQWIRSFGLEEREDITQPLVRGTFPDGTVLASANSFHPNTAVGVNDFAEDFVRFGPDGRFVNMVAAQLPSFTMWRGPDGYSWPVPFGPERFATTDGCTMVTGYTAHATLQRISCDGATGDSVPIEIERRAFPSGEADRQRDLRLSQHRGNLEAGRATDPNGWRRRFLEQVPMPDTLPGYASLAVFDGLTWLTDYLLPDDTLRYATVFDHNNRRVGRMALPGRARLLDVRGGMVVLLAQDEDGVQRVEVYRTTGGS